MFTKRLKKVVTRRKKRVGRGEGSSKGGHTVGKGQKGQTSRAGNHRPRVFEGGQMPLIRKIPKIRGAKSRDNTVAISITQLISREIFEINRESLKTFTKSETVKLVGAASYEGLDLSKIVVKNDLRITKSLKEKILQSGGKVEE